MAPISRRRLLAAPAALAAHPARADLADRLVIGIVADPVTLDPAFAGSFFENQVLYNLHETLLVARPDGTLESGLAARWEQTDRLHWALQIREGLIFHDGTPVDAAAVCANFRRMLDPRTGSIRRNDLGPVTEAVASGPLTVEIRLSEPYAPLLSVLANRAGMMVSPTALDREGADFAARAVGCGAFRLASWTRNSELVLERFPSYWRGASGGFERLLFRPLPDETVRLANLRAGTLHLIDSVPPQSVDQLAKSPELQLAQIPSIGFTAFSLNCTRPPFNSRMVRQAFAAAIDPRVIQHLVYFGTGQIAHGPISPATGWAYDAGFAPPRGDAARAAALLAQADLSAPIPVVITITNAPIMQRIAQILQAQAASAGFAVTLRQIDPTGLLSVLQRRDFDIAMSPWSGRFDPDGNLFFWFSRGGFTNFSGYDNEHVTHLLHAARASGDRAERASLYRQAQAIIVDEAPVLFVHFDAILQAATARLHWTIYPDGALRLFDARLI